MQGHQEQLPLEIAFLWGPSAAHSTHSSVFYSQIQVLDAARNKDNAVTQQHSNVPTKLWIEMVGTMSNCNESINLSRIPGLLTTVNSVWEDFTDSANLSSEAQNQNTCTWITQIPWEKKLPIFFSSYSPLNKKNKSSQQIVVSRLRRFCIIQWYYKTFLVLVV